MRSKTAPFEHKLERKIDNRERKNIMAEPYVESKGSFPRMQAAAKKEMLEHVLKRCESTRASLGRPCVVFDLDGTIFDNRPRSLAIYRELFATWKQQGISLGSKTNDHASVSDLLYLVRDSLMALGVTQEESLHHGEAFWKERFFSDEYQKHDVAVPGAVAFARACYERGANLVYFTGRDMPKMGVGSFVALRDAGFPIGVAGTELVLKPSFDIPDESFKRDACRQLTRLGTIVGSFDNEPGNCNLLREQFPEATHALVDTQHAPGAPALDSRVHVIADFTL
jgi:hypothetical protein